MIRVAGIEKESIVDGPGFRYVIFAQGCPHKCPGCHNQEALDFQGGEEVSIDFITEELSKNPLLQGVTFSGGEPFSQGEAFSELCEALWEKELDITIYTGYTYEELYEMSKKDKYIEFMLDHCHILIDGRYLEKERDLTLQFRGSKNQRIIDMKKTRALNKITLMEEYM